MIPLFLGMTIDKTTTAVLKSKKEAKLSREERRIRALRANLKRRRQQKGVLKKTP